jgi:hypothetical protein
VSSLPTRATRTVLCTHPPVFWSLADPLQVAGLDYSVVGIIPRQLTELRLVLGAERSA